MELQLTLSLWHRSTHTEETTHKLYGRKKYVACRTVGLLIVDKGEVEPGINVINKVLVNWMRHIEGEFIRTLLNIGRNSMFRLGMLEDQSIILEEQCRSCDGRTIHLQISRTRMDKPEI
eukprot:13856059-Heterocapsa_arctica.AAC.1